MSATTDVTIPVHAASGLAPLALRAAVALPERAEGPSPGVVVIHELFGLNDDIRGVCARFAANGYAAIAPHLWSVGSRRACISLVVRELRAGQGGGPVAELVEAARAYLAARPEVDGARMAVIGFCMGGGFALTFAADGPVQAAAVNYGRVPRDSGRLARVCPVVASYGGADPSLRGAPARLERHLADYGVPADVKVYPGASHGFMSAGAAPAWLARLPAPMRPAHDPAATEDAWGPAHDRELPAHVLAERLDDHPDAPHHRAPVPGRADGPTPGLVRPDGAVPAPGVERADLCRHVVGLELFEPEGAGPEVAEEGAELLGRQQPRWFHQSMASNSYWKTCLSPARTETKTSTGSWPE